MSVFQFGFSGNKKHHTRMTSDHIRICFYRAEREQRRFSSCFRMIDSSKALVNLRIFVAYDNFNMKVLAKSKCLKMFFIKNSYVHIHSVLLGPKRNS